MSENSPRWPGRNGSPGLDFSPYRKEGEQADQVAPVANEGASAMTDTVAHPVVTPSPGRPPAAKGAPATTERVAKTAQEWAAVPVAGIPAAPTVAAPPAEPSTPSRPEPVATAPAASVHRGSRRTRKARLRLSRIDPWSVMKTTLLFSIAFGIMGLVVAFVLWSVLAGSGALESANTLINTVLGDSEGGEAAFRVEEYLTVQRVMGFAVVLAVIDAVIITAVTTLFAFLYNLAATVMGGLEVTLAED